MIKPNERFAVSAYTQAATANGAILMGATPVVDHVVAPIVDHVVAPIEKLIPHIKPPKIKKPKWMP